MSTLHRRCWHHSGVSACSCTRRWHAVRLQPSDGERLDVQEIYRCLRRALIERTRTVLAPRAVGDGFFGAVAEPELRRQLEAKTEADRYHRIKTQIVGALTKFSFLGAHITLQLRAHARWQSSTAMSQQSRAGSLGHHSQIGAEVEKILHAAVVPSDAEIRARFLENAIRPSSRPSCADE